MWFYQLTNRIHQQNFSIEFQAVFAFGLMRFTLEYKKTPASAIPVPASVPGKTMSITKKNGIKEI